jgi:hypothetical protein
MVKSIAGFDMHKFTKEFNIDQEAKTVDLVCERDSSGGSSVLIHSIS